MSHTVIALTESLLPNGGIFQPTVHLQQKPWFTTIIKNLLLLFLPAVLFFSKTFGQTFPAASSCTSKDLTLVNATLPGTDVCNNCTPGDSVNRTLQLAIFNKTGSTRTSFAFWGTLEIRNSDGSFSSSTSISGCGGPVIKNTTTSLSFNRVGYACGQSLTIKNLFLAWTDASPGSTCPLNSALIAPKCGTLDSIRINTGLDASFAVTNATCTASGSINMTPLGGKSPYSYSWAASNSGVMPAGQSTNQDLTGLISGTYTVTITDANNCTANRLVNITAPAQIATPTAVVTQPTCTTSTGSASVNNFDNTITYTLKQIGVLKYTANGSGVFNAVVAGAYDLIATKGNCSASGSINVDAQPATPDAPSANVTQPTCAIAHGTITITAPLGAGITYSINGTDYQSGATFNIVDAGDYNITARTNGCTSGATNKTVNPQPATPDAPSAGVTQPTCAIAKGTITVTAPLGAGITYSINGTDYQPSTTFNNVDPGIYNVTVKANGCTSGATNKTVNPQPDTPDAPSAGVTQPTCAIAKGTITVTAPLGAGITYSINGTDYQPGTTFNNVDAGIYNVTAKANGCTSGATNKTVNPQPDTPDAPSVCIVQPSLCGSAGSVTINGPMGNGYEYSIDNGATWHTTNIFSNLGAGSVSGIKVKSPAGCVSVAADCDPSDCQTQTAGRSQTTISTQNQYQRLTNTLNDPKVSASQATVKAYPNPFGNKVKFLVTVPEAGNGSLELLNLLGQKVKTVFQGRMPAGVNTFEVNLPLMQSAQLIYILRMGDKQVRGKLLQLAQ